MTEPGARASGLMLDLYHVDSAYVSWRTERNEDATFDLYTRHDPFGGGFLLVAGVDEAIDFACAYGFSDEDIAYLRTCKQYPEDFLSSLRGLRFTGEILAMPEGEVVFPHEPILRVTAPFREALLLESALLHALSLQTLIATKAARVVRAAAGRPVSEFALRRAHEPYAVTRSAWIAGVASTSFVDAARIFGVPASGTIPHALVQAFDTEELAFRAVAEALDPYLLLLDTYDVRAAIRTAIEVARDARARTGHRLAGVRLDSGDLAADARYCRSALDDAGMHDVRILASGDLDEYAVARLVADGAPIDAFGVGTAMGVGAGSVEHRVPGTSLGAVYKLVWLDRADGSTIKRAGEKSTWPGRKQVYRIGDFEQDVIALDDEPAPPNSRPLLEPAVVGGARVREAEPLGRLRARAAERMAALPEDVGRLTDPRPYPVVRSERLRELRERALARLGL